MTSTTHARQNVLGNILTAPTAPTGRERLSGCASEKETDDYVHATENSGKNLAAATATPTGREQGWLWRRDRHNPHPTENCRKITTLRNIQEWREDDNDNNDNDTSNRNTSHQDAGWGSSQPSCSFFLGNERSLGPRAERNAPVKAWSNEPRQFFTF